MTVANIGGGDQVATKVWANSVADDVNANTAAAATAVAALAAVDVELAALPSQYMSGRSRVILADTAQSIPNVTATDIAWSTEVADADGWTSGGSATLTVPAGLGGLYLVSYSATFAASVGTAAGVQCLIAGTAAYAVSNPSLWLPSTLTFLRTFVAGDTIKFQVYHTNGAAVNCTSRLEIAGG